MSAPVILHHLDPCMGSVERVAVTLFAEFVARGLLRDGEHLKRAYQDWRSGDEGVRQDFLKLSRDILQVAAVDPDRLRWCDWPSCMASYDAAPGPAERGWARHPYALLCPAHAPLGHGPSVRWDGDVLTAVCTCGASEEVSPTNGAAVKSWWRGHVAQLPAVTS